ncbi:Sulfide dehydrogenase [Gammaproteobacteria bacterium]
MHDEKKHDQANSTATPSRRSFLRTSVGLGGLALLDRSGLSAAEEGVDLPFANGHRPLIAYPQKQPLMVMTSRPVQLETPFNVFNEGVFTPNKSFFVRWHLAGMPTEVDPNTFRLKVYGQVKQELYLSLDELKRNFESVEIAAVCQCAGNSRGFSEPRVPGGQWGNGAMGNALWKGIRLRDLLNKAGLAADAVQVKLNGLDTPVLPATPDFAKNIEMDLALNEDVIVAYAMNGEPLPLLNGYPLRLVVPGWYATYWVKMLNDIEVLGKADQGFWMNPAYRIPADPCACQEPGQQGVKTVPISRMNVRSFITSLKDGDKIAHGHINTVTGIAFDGGFGIKKVLFSTDGGKQWQEAELDKDYGKYSFRQWRAHFQPVRGQSYELMSMAINQIGETQRFTPMWNPAGYMRNVVETVRVHAG